MKWKWRHVFWTGGGPWVVRPLNALSVSIYGPISCRLRVKNGFDSMRHVERNMLKPRVCVTWNSLQFHIGGMKCPVVLWFLWKAPVCMLYTETNYEPCEELSLRGLIGMVWHDPIMKFHIWNLNFTWIPKHISLSSGSCLHSIFNFQEYMFVNLAHNTF